MRRPLKMTIDIKEILRLHCCGLSIREIAQKTGVPRTSVSRYLQRAKAEDIHWDKIKTLARAEVSQMFAVCGKETERQASLDCPAIVQEMKAYRLTIEQAYKRYLDRVTKSGIKPYWRSKFFACIAEYRQAHTISKVSLAIDWIMGDACQIDFCGDTLKIYDREAQKWITVYFFAGILCYSGYCFLRAVLDQTRETWLRMMSEMISCFGGAPKQLILDNAKAGVLKADRYSPMLAPEVVAFGKYYNISIEATYPVSPTHKGAVENSVGLLQGKIIAAGRGMTSFNIEDLNRDIAKELEEFNRTPIKNSPHSPLTTSSERRSFCKPFQKNHLQSGQDTSPIQPTSRHASAFSDINTRYHVNTGTRRCWFASP